MTPDYEAAAELASKAQALFNRHEEAMLASVTALQTATKKASGGIRQAVDDLNSGMQRFDKIANFNNLERYVGLLERSAAALSVLADLEKAGKLEKIITAIK